MGKKEFEWKELALFLQFFRIFMYSGLETDQGTLLHLRINMENSQLN